MRYVVVAGKAGRAISIVVESISLRLTDVFPKQGTKAAAHFGLTYISLCLRSINSAYAIERSTRRGQL